METLNFKVYVVRWLCYVKDYKRFYNFNVFNTYEEASQFMNKLVQDDYHKEMQDKPEDILHYELSEHFACIETKYELLQYHICEEIITLDKTIACMLTQLPEDSYNIKIVSCFPTMQEYSPETCYEYSFLRQEIPEYRVYNPDDKLIIFPNGLEKLLVNSVPDDNNLRNEVVFSGKTHCLDEQMNNNEYKKYNYEERN